MYKKLPTISLIALLVCSLVISLMFFICLGDVQVPSPTPGKMLDDSTYTDLLLWWSYALFAVTLVITIVFTIIRFVKLFAEKPGKAVRILVVLIAFAAIFVITWALGSENELVIPGYTGDQNVGLWSRFSDMMIYTSYVLVVATLLAWLGSTIYSKIKK